MTDGHFLLPGIHRRLPFDKYKLLSFLNHSTLKNIKRSPMHLAYLAEHPQPATAALQRGSLVHDVILLPDKKFVIWEGGDRRKKDVKEKYDALVAAHGEENITAKVDHDLACAIRDAVLNDPFARPFFFDKFSLADNREVSFVGEDQETHLMLKGRADLQVEDIIVELKTAESCSRDDFEKSIFNYSYHTQQAFYRKVAAACGVTITDHVFVVVESNPPHAVAVYRLLDDVVNLGAAIVRDWLDTYAECVRSRIWPGPSTGIQDIGLPTWAVRKTEQLLSA
jgi:hypothetical protein